MMYACRESFVRRRIHFVVVVLFAALLSGAATTAAALPVIPSGVGYGINAVAGRGGTVHKVTNLNASGAGSLAACVQASGPRVCIFEVSGVITLTQDMVFHNPYLTIAGQTAPSPGIMIRGAALVVAAPEVLIQHITIRAGDAVAGPVATNRDSFRIDGCCGQPIANVVVDHCTFSWGVDETISTNSNHDLVTINNSIMSEGLHFSPILDHSGTGPLLGGYAGKSRTSMIGNLVAHNSHRNPLTSALSFVFVNNVVYNANREGLVIQGQSGRTDSSIVGNVFQSGPSTGVLQNSGSSYLGIHALAVNGSGVYLSDNARMTSNTAPQVPQANQWSNVWFDSSKTQANFKVDNPPVWVQGLTAMPVANVRASVLANAGSRPADRSQIDQRIINDVKNGTGVTKNCVAASHCRAAPYNNNAGGWPVYAQNSRPLTLPANPNSDSDGDGYTNLEEWLHGMAAQVEGQSATQPEPPTDLAAVQ